MRKIWTTNTGISQAFGGVSQIIRMAVEHVGGEYITPGGNHEEWVSKNDYNKLKAENERLKSELASEKAKVEKSKEALNKIANKQTCEELNPGCEKYKNYEDGWNGVAEYARQALKELFGNYKMGERE